MSELDPDIHQINLIITPAAATETDSHLHPQLIVDPAQYHRPQQGWTDFPFKLRRLN